MRCSQRHTRSRTDALSDVRNVNVLTIHRRPTQLRRDDTGIPDELADDLRAGSLTYSFRSYPSPTRACYARYERVRWQRQSGTAAHSRLPGHNSRQGSL